MNDTDLVDIPKRPYRLQQSVWIHKRRRATFCTFHDLLDVDGPTRECKGLGVAPITGSRRSRSPQATRPDTCPGEVVGPPPTAILDGPSSNRMRTESKCGAFRRRSGGRRQRLPMVPAAESRTSLKASAVSTLTTTPIHFPTT